MSAREQTDSTGIPTVAAFDPFDHYGMDFFRTARAKTPVFYRDKAPALVDEDGDAHRVRRDATIPPFRSDRIKDLDPFIRKQIDTRLDAVVKSGGVEQPGDDIVSETHRNLEAADAVDLTFLDLYALDIVITGHETTANTMAGGIQTLLEHPDQYAALIEDPSLIPNAADEILRFDTGVPTWRQLVIEDFALPSGATIPAGSKVYVALNSANRDEAVFADPESFDVRRRDAAHPQRPGDR